LKPVELALGYVRSRWYLGAMIVGATTVDQLAEDLAAATTVLDPETMAAIARLQERFPSPAA
jgi:aryl-alcohol dehydrogenase-like predicted oxidoreductase